MFIKGKIIPLALVLLVIGCAPLSRAQVDDKEKAEQEAAKQKELEKRALKLLDEAVAGAEGLKLRENRTYILGVAADVLWPHDETRARMLFWEALANLNLQSYQEKNAASPKAPPNAATPARSNGPSKEQLEALNKFYAILNERNDFLYKVARRDPQLALDMLRSTRLVSSPNIPGTARFDPDAQLEQEFTLATAANDPKRAVQLFRETLAKGSNYQLLNLLREINRRDQDTGTQLTGEIIAKLQTENLNAANSYAPYLAVNLLHSSRENGAILGLMYEGESAPPVTRLKLDDHQKQDLVYLLTDAALSATGGGNAVRAVQSVMPEIEQYAPDRLAKVKARVAENDSTLPPNVRAWNTFNAKFEKATPEEMIKAANQLSEDQRRALFFQAADKAVAGGETDRYREVLNNIEDENQRKLALEALDSEQMNYDIVRGKTDDLEKLVGLIRGKEQRATAMTELALQLERKDQHDAALKLLDEARSLVKVDLANEAQSNALLAVMMACALIDPTKAFGMIEPIIDRTNEEVSKLALVDKVIKTGAIKDGEVVMNQPQMSLEYAFNRYAAGLVALGKTDFEHTQALAERFQRNELKVTARLLIARAILRAAAKAPNNQR